MFRKVHAVGVILQNEKGEILTLRRNTKSIEGGKLGLVGGVVEEGEESKQSTIREAIEEIGYTINSNDIQFV